jgi:hypothetical protein
MQCCRHGAMVGADGHDPPSPGESGRRSTVLSYAPSETMRPTKRALLVSWLGWVLLMILCVVGFLVLYASLYG